MNKLNYTSMKREVIEELRRKAYNNYHAWLPNYVRLKEHSVIETKYLSNGKAVNVPREMKTRIGGVICPKSKN